MNSLIPVRLRWRDFLAWEELYMAALKLGDLIGRSYGKLLLESKMQPRSKITRREKIAAEIQQEVSQIVHSELLDPRVEGVTVTNVRVTPDLRLARVYFSLQGDAKKIKAAEAGLESSSGFMKRALADRLFLKFVPNLEFFFDESLELQKKIDLLFEEIESQKKSSGIQKQKAE